MLRAGILKISIQKPHNNTENKCIFLFIDICVKSILFFYVLCKLLLLLLFRYIIFIENTSK